MLYERRIFLAFARFSRIYWDLCGFLRFALGKFGKVMDAMIFPQPQAWVEDTPC